MVAVIPRCQLGTVEHYIAADMVYYPCCWIADAWNGKHYRDFLGEENLNQIDTREHSIADIEASKAMQKLRESWEQGTFEPCARICGKPLDQNHSPDRRNRTDLHMMINLNTKELKYL